MYSNVKYTHVCNGEARTPLSYLSIYLSITALWTRTLAVAAATAAPGSLIDGLQASSSARPTSTMKNSLAGCHSPAAGGESFSTRPKTSILHDPRGESDSDQKMAGEADLDTVELLCAR